MTNIHGVQPPIAPKPVEPTGNITAAGPAKVSPAPVADTVEISQVARLAAKAQEIPEVRTELVQRVKAEIEAGAYDSPQKVDIAVDRLMEELFPLS